MNNGVYALPGFMPPAATNKREDCIRANEDGSIKLCVYCGLPGSKVYYSLGVPGWDFGFIQDVQYYIDNKYPEEIINRVRDCGVTLEEVSELPSDVIVPVADINGWPIPITEIPLENKAYWVLDIPKFILPPGDTRVQISAAGRVVKYTIHRPTFTIHSALQTGCLSGTGAGNTALADMVAEHANDTSLHLTDGERETWNERLTSLEDSLDSGIDLTALPLRYGSNVVAASDECGDKAIALGNNNLSTATYSTTLGSDNKATGYGSTAVGHNNKATSHSSSALGYNNKATGFYSTAVGYYNQTADQFSSAVGYYNEATAQSSSALGYNNKATAHSSSALGYYNRATGYYSTAVGYGNEATIQHSSALGSNNQTAGLYATAVGTYNEATGYYSTAVGNCNQTAGSSSVALGTSNYTEGYNSIALGYGSRAIGHASIAIGDTSYAEGYNSTAIGNRAYSAVSGSIALGQYSSSNAPSSAALGISARTDKTGSLVISATNQDNGTSVSLELVAGTATGGEGDMFSTDKFVTDTDVKLTVRDNLTGREHSVSVSLSKLMQHLVQDLQGVSEFGIPGDDGSYGYYYY